MVGNKNKDKKWENMIRYKVKTRLITDLSPYKPVKKKEVFIVRENTDTGVWIPSKLSEFIIVSASGLPINTKKNIAYKYCFIKIEIYNKFKVKSLLLYIL